MWTVLFVITTIIFAFRAIVKDVMYKAVLYYMIDKKYTAPTKREFEQCIGIVVKNTINDWFKKKRLGSASCNF